MASHAALPQPDPVWRDRIVGFAVAVCCHAAVLSFAGAALVKLPEYGIEPGGGGIEVNLVAALPQSALDAIPAAGQAEPSPIQDDREPVLAQPTESLSTLTSIASPANTASPQQITASPFIGDGSSAVPGHDATTRYRPGGSWTNAKPSRFRNPAPRYPELARQQGQEGLVMLVVVVDTTGHPRKVSVKQSSGFPLLDDAATTAVSRWRFAPGRAGGVPIESTVEVPIRFRLADEQ